MEAHDGELCLVKKNVVNNLGSFNLDINHLAVVLCYCQLMIAIVVWACSFMVPVAFQLVTELLVTAWRVEDNNCRVGCRYFCQNTLSALPPTSRG